MREGDRAIPSLIGIAELEDRHGTRPTVLESDHEGTCDTVPCESPLTLESGIYHETVALVQVFLDAPRRKCPSVS